MTNAAALDNARWEALWVAGGKVIRKDCGTDLAEAVRIYTLAVQAGKRAATLRCKNVAFPPPDKYYRRPVRRKEKVNGRTVIVTDYVSVMNEVNRKGAFWCPYCMQLRKFVRRKGFEVSGVWVSEPHYACPICGVTHTNFAVKRFNPVASRMAASTRQVAQSPEEKRKARAARRRKRLTQQED